VVDQAVWISVDDPSFYDAFTSSRHQVNRWIAQGALPSRVIGNGRYVRRATLDAYLAPARQAAEQLQVRRDAGLPVFSPEQLTLLRSALGSLTTTVDRRASA
jgi:hypothetical protein